MERHAHNDSDRYTVGYKRRTAVAEKRQRNTGNGHKSDTHTDIFDSMENKHCGNSGAKIFSEQRI